MAKFIKGLSKDTSPEDQPQGTWRYAKNITMHPTDGALTSDPGCISVESLLGRPTPRKGNELVNRYEDNDIAQFIEIKLPYPGMIVIGSIEIEDDRVILFLAFDWNLIEKAVETEDPDVTIDFVNSPNPGDLPNIWNNGEYIYGGEIAEFDGATYKTLYRSLRRPADANIDTDMDLKFNVNNPIEGTYKKNPDGELFVYWTDDTNAPRAINITRQKNWLRSGLIQSGPQQGTTISNNIFLMPNRFHYLYGIDWQFTSNPRHIDLLNLFPASGPVPNVQFGDVTQGGGLLTGAYFLALAYVDQDLVQTNYVVVANPVHIVEDPEGVLPIERYDGAKPKSASGKSITWEVSNLNTDYEFVRPAIVRKGGGAAQAFQLNDIPLRNLVRRNNGGDLINNFITFTGLEGFGESSVSDIIIDTVAYDTAKTINQLDGILYLGNLSGQKDLGYQKYANNIKLEPEIKPLTPFDPHQITEDVLDNNYIATDPLGWDWNAQGLGNPIQQGYRWNENLFKFKGYTRDEVYAFYIAFIMNDGTESYAYHIPGRGPLQLTRSQSQLVPTWSNADGNPNFDANTDIFLGDGSNFESGDILNEGLLQSSDGKGRIFHFYETSRLVGARNMNFWQNTNEFYPTDVLNRGNWEIWDAASEYSSILGGIEYTPTETLSGRRVRHHHFPSNESYDGDNGFDNSGFQTFGTTDTSDMEVSEVDIKWYALDFNVCTAITEEGDPIFSGTIMSDVIEDYGVSADDLQESFQDEGLEGSSTESWLQAVEAWNAGFGGADEGDQDGELMLFAGDTMPYTGGFTWPTVGQVINFAFIRRRHENAGNQRFAASYGSSMYEDNDDEIGGVNWPGSWNGSCGWALGQEFVQGGGTFGSSFRHNNGGPSGASGCRHVSNNVDLGWLGTIDQQPHHCEKSIYWPFGCLCIHGIATLLSVTTSWCSWRNQKRAGCGGPESGKCSGGSGGCDECDKSARPVVVWANDTGSDNVLLVARRGNSNVGWPDTWTNPLLPFSPNECDAFIWFQRGSQSLSGPIYHSVRTLGFSLDDIKVPQEIADKTQGFRVYYAQRNHEDRRILGQNLLHPQVPSRKPTFGQCVGAATLEGVEGFDGNSGTMSDDQIQNKNHFWVNWPYAANQRSYESVFEDRGEDFLEYQSFAFHDFYLMRSRRTITPATHLKIEYAVDMMPWAGPGLTQDCEAGTDDFDWDPGTAIPGYTPCWQLCLDTTRITAGFQIAIAYYNATQTGTFGGDGTTGGQTLYNWFGNHDPNTLTIGDLNRPLKERSKSYVKGDSIFNGKQLGFGYKTYNEYGESHIALAVHERYGIVPAFHNSDSNDGANPVGIVTDFAYGEGVTYQDPNGRHSMYYQGNLHAFRLDMYNSIDTQNLVWTGFQVVGEVYKMFTVGQQTIKGTVIDEEDKYGTKKVFEYFEAQTEVDPNTTPAFKEVVRDIKYIEEDGKIFGGDTHITRHGWRRHLRGNLSMEGSTFLDNVGNYMGRDVRFMFETVVESPDNINFRHVENKRQLYWPGSTIRELLETDNEIDFTGIGNMAYNEDYSAVNDLGHTSPLPLQVSQPSDFPTRVVRSVKSDDSSLVDSYRKFLPNQFKDLAKTRGELWKISVFSNLLYFHMEDSILRTKGKQTMQMSDKSQAFIGSGDIFAQPPDELVQTDAGYGGTQSQWATVVTSYGYFCLNQKERVVYMISDGITNISSLGMEKWFQKNIPYAIEAFQAKAPTDNPYLFGFTAQWDEEYKRILLTKKELVPSRAFLRLWNQGHIKYDTGENVFYWRQILTDEDGNPLVDEVGELTGETTDFTPVLWTALPQSSGEGGFITGYTSWDWNTQPPPHPYTGNIMTQAEVDEAINVNGWLIFQIPSGAFNPSSTEYAYVWAIPNSGPTGGYNVNADSMSPAVPISEEVDGETLFEPTGWTISYNPEINAWVSFHHEIPYHYTYIGENTFSFHNFIHRDMTSSHTTVFGLYENTSEIIYDNRFFGQDIWWHHPNEYYVAPLSDWQLENQDVFNTTDGEVLDQQIENISLDRGVSCSNGSARPTSAIIEVIHNEMPGQVKLFHNFSFDSNTMKTGLDRAITHASDQQQGIPGEDTGPITAIVPWSELQTPIRPYGIVNQYNVLNSTQEFRPGFEAAILYNSHQCSGLIRFRYLQNIRRTAVDWNVNKFRDRAKFGTVANFDSYGLQWFLWTNSGNADATNNAPGVYPTIIGVEQAVISAEGWDWSTDPNLTRREFGTQMWFNAGMDEALNVNMLDPNPFIATEVARTKQESGRKFVDKWIGLRLICSSREKIVNLLSTKVGTRKYHRHDKK
tara:strand:+ start:2481 stop:9389 length:6909 start_codon:yes stop_codon:yes gene_type:complete